MGLLEKIIWLIVGYSVMPLIFVAGFVMVALASLFVLQLLGLRSDTQGGDSRG